MRLFRKQIVLDFDAWRICPACGERKRLREMTWHDLDFGKAICEDCGCFLEQLENLGVDSEK